MKSCGHVTNKKIPCPKQIEKWQYGCYRHRKYQFPDHEANIKYNEDNEIIPIEMWCIIYKLLDIHELSSLSTTCKIRYNQIYEYLPTNPIYAMILSPLKTRDGSRGDSWIPVSMIPSLMLTEPPYDIYYNSNQLVYQSTGISLITGLDIRYKLASSSSGNPVVVNINSLTTVNKLRVFIKTGFYLKKLIILGKNKDELEKNVIAVFRD